MEKQIKVTYKSIEFDVVCDYQPHEKETRDNPEVHESVEIYNAFVGGVDFMVFLEDDVEFEKVVLENIKSTN